jgi:hypothetical protein
MLAGILTLAAACSWQQQGLGKGGIKQVLTAHGTVQHSVSRYQ